MNEQISNMLHELLLSLSGHPSPLLHADGQFDESLGALLSPSEKYLLHKLARLGIQYMEVRSAAATVNSSHPSIVCKAVAASILDTHLGRYQDKIIEVEKGILQKDSKFVAAYNIVPLSTIVLEFEGWTQILMWLRQLLDFIQNREEVPGQSAPPKSGAQVMDHLRAELRTGYPDIENTCSSLLLTAETAWMRQLSSWLLHGRLPASGSEDFFVRPKQGKEGFDIIPDLVPGFVTRSTCISALFVGSFLSRLYKPGSHVLPTDDHFKLGWKPYFSESVSQLSSQDSPISTTTLTRTVKSVQYSLARNLLRRLLPTATALRALKVLHEFLLLQRGEFAVALISNADQHLHSRRLGSSKGQVPLDQHNLGGAMIKEAELSTILNKTWASLMALQSSADNIEDEVEDEELEAAREMLSLDLLRNKAEDEETHAQPFAEKIFQDFLVGTPTVLNIAITSPIDLFLSHTDVQIYSQANASLLAIRRAHLHLTGLWKLSVLRKTYPSPPRPVTPATQFRLTRDRERAMHRNLIMRSVWDGCNQSVSGAAHRVLSRRSDCWLLVGL